MGLRLMRRPEQLMAHSSCHAVRARPVVHASIRFCAARRFIASEGLLRIMGTRSSCDGGGARGERGGCQPAGGGLQAALAICSLVLGAEERRASSFAQCRRDATYVDCRLASEGRTAEMQSDANPRRRHARVVGS